jgi:hypothetical protein
MPTITPALNIAVTNVPRVIWEGVVTGDTLLPLRLEQQYGLAASVQAVGTFGGATIGLQVSNDGTNWATAKDLTGNNVSMTAATGYFEISLSGAYIRPTIAGGSGNDIDIIVVLRGSHAL